MTKKTHTIEGRMRQIHLAAAVALAPMLMTAFAEDLTVAVGETVAITTSTNYGAITVYGTLNSQTKDKYVGAGSISIVGGTLTVGRYDIPRCTMGDWTNYSTPATISAANGKYGTLSVGGNNNVSFSGTGNWRERCLCVSSLVIEQEPEGFVGETLDNIVTLDSGSINFSNGITNNSSLKAVFDIRRPYCYIYRYKSSSAGDVFGRGAFEISLDSSYNTCLYIVGIDTGASFNSADATVDVTGKGTLNVRAYGNTPFEFRSGAKLDFDGPLVLYRYADKKAVTYLFSTDVTGSMLKEIRTESPASTYPFTVKVADGVTLTAPPVFAVTNDYSYLTGGDGAKILIGAADTDYVFKGNIKAGDPLTLWKTGACEVAISSATNIPCLVLDGGTVRFTDDCVIESLTATNGAARIVADGCVVTLPGDVPGFCSTETANGGSFAGSTIFRSSSFDLSNVRFAAGTTNVFSSAATANTNRWWRWTFTKLYSPNAGLRLMGLYLFDNEGTWVNSNLDRINSPYYVTNANYSVLAAGKARFYCSNATNVIGDTVSVNKLDAIRRLFMAPSKNNNGNWYAPHLTSPIIDETNPDSAVAIEFCLNTSANSAGYNLRRSSADGQSKRHPVSWIVESSADGQLDTWTIADVRTDVAWNDDSTARITIDGTEAVTNEQNAVACMDLTRFPLQPITTPVTLQVEEGAVVDFRSVAGGQPVSGITIDWSNPAQGEILGARPAANGTLNFVNLPSGTVPSSFALPFDSGVDTSALTGWSVTVDGVAREWKIKSNGDGTYRCAPPLGFILIYR